MDNAVYGKTKAKLRNRIVLFTDTDSLRYEIKTDDVYEDFSNAKEMFDFSNYSTKSKYYDSSKKISGWQNEDETVAIEEFGRLKPKMYSYLVNDNSEHETAGAAIAEFVRLKPKMYSYLVNNNSEHKSPKGVDRSIVAIMSHNEKKMFY